MQCDETSVGATEAIVSSSILTAIFVGSLYLPWNRGDRDHVPIVRSRLTTLLSVTVLSELYVRSRVPRAVHEDGGHPLAGAAAALLLTLMMYAGHVLALGVRGLRDTVYHAIQRPRWLASRDYVLAPFLEELVFRRHSLLLWRCLPMAARVYGPAALFSLAHAHHARRGHLASAVVQLAYTFVFGAYAAALYAFSRSIAAAVAAHVLCNFMGVPDLPAISAHKHQRSITVAYVIAVCLVFVIFVPLLRAIAPGGLLYFP